MKETKQTHSMGEQIDNKDTPVPNAKRGKFKLITSFPPKTRKIKISEDTPPQQAPSSSQNMSVTYSQQTITKSANYCFVPVLSFPFPRPVRWESRVRSRFCFEKLFPFSSLLPCNLSVGLRQINVWPTAPLLFLEMHSTVHQ